MRNRFIAVLLLALPSAHAAQTPPAASPTGWGGYLGREQQRATQYYGIGGRSVTDDITIPHAILAAHLRATPALLAEYFRISAVGAVLSGAIGVQGHYANGLAALFLACGQDVACVSESSAGITRFEETDDGSLYACVTIPSLVVGTVRGGTGLPSQRACLDLLDLEEPNSANELAEVCAAVVLPGELSIVGAIVANEFTQAHVSPGRAKAVT